MNATLDTDQIAGRVLMVGLPGPALDRPTADRLGALRPGGVILFARNLPAPWKALELIDDLRAVLPRPALFAVDQEGGRVSRLESWIGPTPTAASLAASGEQAAARFGRATARVLRSLGFNVDFAPVVDVCGAQSTNGIGDRSFGTDPERVAVLAGAFLAAVQAEGVAGCLKHFPGLGATSVDSHVELPTACRSPQQLEDVELVPFRRLAAHAPAVMVAHGHYPALDPTPGLPATLSPEIVGRLLRSEIGFAGLVVSDDMEMGAIGSLDEHGEAAVRAIGAGCDLVLYCADLERAARARARLAAHALSDAGFGRRLRDAADAVERAARRWPAVPGDLASFETARRELERASRPGDR